MALIGYAHWKNYAIPVYDNRVSHISIIEKDGGPPVGSKFERIYLRDIPVLPGKLDNLSITEYNNKYSMYYFDKPTSSVIPTMFLINNYHDTVINEDRTKLLGSIIPSSISDTFTVQEFDSTTDISLYDWSKYSNEYIDVIIMRIYSDTYDGMCLIYSWSFQFNKYSTLSGWDSSLPLSFYDGSDIIRNIKANQISEFLTITSTQYLPTLRYPMFYIQTPSMPVSLKPGESVSIQYMTTNKDGSLSLYENVGYRYVNDFISISGNTLTVSDKCSMSTITAEAYPKDYPPDGLVELSAIITINVADPLGEYDPGGTSVVIGGGGSFTVEPSDDISKDIPSGSVSGNVANTSTFTRYLVNEQYLNIFGEWLWTTDLGLSVAKTVISAIYGDPAESIISLMSYPFNLNGIQGVTRTNQNLYWGSFDSGLPFVALTSNSGTIDWGTIELKEFWGNFLDYTPHTKIELYLPWGTGFVSIDPGECLPGTIQVKTNIDFAKGSCIHFVIGNKGSVIGTYAGQCAQQIPVFSTDFASKIAGMVTAAAAGITVGAAGAIGAAAGYNLGKGIGTYDMQGNFTPQRTGKYRYTPAPIVEAEEQAVSNVQSTGRMAGKIATTSLAINKSPTHVSRNGGFTDGSAGLGIQYPYIILSRPTQSVPKQYGSFYGYPANIFTSLNTVQGYTEVGEIHLDGQTTATNEELNEIDRILKEGAIL